MKKRFLSFLAFLLLLSACSRAGAPSIAIPTLAPTIAMPTETSTPTITPKPSATPTQTRVPPTATPSATPTPSYPPLGRGPTVFDPGINPLTGLEVKDPALLNRRPIVIKVENIPRSHRPQWGLSLADIIYEYYTEFGATRFAAVFYGNDAERVGPIRSGRFFDSNVVEMYKAVFVYGSAYPPVQERFFSSTFSRRLVLETSQSCPGLCRYDPNGQNLLVSNTAALAQYLASRGVDNSPQNQDGMFFQMQPPSGGEAANQVFLRYSGAIYNRWDYNPASGVYLRFVDKEDDVNRNNEVYDQLTDRLTGQAITAQNVVTLCVPHQYFVKREDAEVLDIIMDGRVASYMGCDGKTYNGGSGPAYIARDGQMYAVTWQRSRPDAVLTLIDANGNPFPFKPGQTWYEVIGASSTVTAQEDGAWKFVHFMTP